MNTPTDAHDTRDEAVMVPREPTDAMIEAARDAIAGDAKALYRGEPESVRLFYRAMLAARPASPVQMGEGRIWVVTASQGDYSDRSEWVVEAHWTEAEGQAAVERLTRDEPGDPSQRYDWQISYYLEETKIAYAPIARRVDRAAVEKALRDNMLGGFPKAADAILALFNQDGEGGK